MSRRTTAEAFADAAAAMTGNGEAGDILVKLLGDCADVLDVAAVAILVTDAKGRLSLLSSSSAVAAELEMLQAQDQHGPCVDVVRTGEVVVARSPEDIVRRWGRVGAVIVEAGFEMVEAHPLVWRGHVLGGLNVFRETPHERSPEQDALIRAFANVATIVLLHSSDIATEQVAARVHEAVMARGTVEQAKGVLSEVEHLDMETATRRLHEMAAAAELTVTEAAQRVLAQAQRPHH